MVIKVVARITFILVIWTTTVVANETTPLKGNDDMCIILEFYKDVDVLTAKESVSALGHLFIEYGLGQDKRVGPSYYYGLGPRYRVCPDNETKKKALIAQCQNMGGVYQIRDMAAYKTPLKNVNNVQLIVVFKKTVTPEVARKTLDKFNATYHSGADSSRGKAYFYKTGPRYIMEFEGEAKREAFKKSIHPSPDIYEVYVPDWNKRKD